MGRDGIAGLVMLAGSVALYGATLPIQSNPLVPVSPALYQRVVLRITALLSAEKLAGTFDYTRQLGNVDAIFKRVLGE